MPPNPTVTDLQPTSVELCLGEDTVEFKATTSPPTERVKWTVAVNGGAPQEVPGGGDDGNTLVVGGQPGETKVVTATLTNSLSATASWKIVGIKIDVLPEPDNGRYVITD